MYCDVVINGRLICCGKTGPQSFYIIDIICTSIEYAVADIRHLNCIYHCMYTLLKLLIVVDG